MTAVRTYLNKMEAELAKGLLASEDIDSVIQADDCDGMRPNLWLSGVRLVVRPEDVARADKVLAEVDSEIS